MTLGPNEIDGKIPKPLKDRKKGKKKEEKNRTKKIERQKRKWLRLSKFGVIASGEGVEGVE